MLIRKIIFWGCLLFCLPVWATAPYYVRSSDGDDGDSCESWALACATLAHAVSLAAAGEVIYMDDDHSEAGTILTWSTSGTYANPIKVYVVTTDTTTPVTAPSGSPNIDNTSIIYISGGAYFWGINIDAGDSLRTTGNATRATFENSYISDASVDASSAFRTQGELNELNFIDTSLEEVHFFLQAGGRFNWRGGTYVVSGTAYSYLIRPTTDGGRIDIEGVDLSQWNGATSLIENTTSFTTLLMSVNIFNVRLPSSVTIFDGTPGNFSTDGMLLVDAAGNADEYYGFYHNNAMGSALASTSVYLSGGSTYDGVNGISYSITTTASAGEYFNCVRERLLTRTGVDATSSANVALHITYDDSSVWYNDDFYIEVKAHNATNEALGNWFRTKPTNPLESLSRDSFTDVSGTDTWIGTSGFSNPQEETVDIDFTAADGAVEIWGVLCKPSSTVYIDLSPTVN